MKIGERLRALRGMLNMTQTQLAQAIGVTKTSIVNWENGHRILSPQSEKAALAWIDRARDTKKYKNITRR